MLKKVALVAGIVIMAVLIIVHLPHTVIQESSATQFVLNVPFKEVQKSIRKGNFEQETLKINNAELLQKQWIDRNFNIQRPLKADRYWEFSGRLLAKVRVDNPQAGKMDVELVEDIFFATNRIEVKTQLAKPLAIGVSDIRQEIVIYPYGQTTRVELSSNITLKRFVPWFMTDYARKQVKSATEQSVSKMESILRNLK